MTDLPLEPRRTALLLVDLQNEIIRPEGAYARAGVTSAEISALPGRLKPVAERMRSVAGWIVSAQFTLVPGRGGAPFIPEPVRRHRPFLGKGDFEAGRRGHELVSELKPADITVETVTYSAFNQSRLEWVLHQAEVDTLLVGGLATHLDVAETVKDALKRDFKVLVLEDGCASFDHDSHRKALKDLATVAPLCSCRDAVSLLR
jgi:nicotinamidase-related amidase